MAKRLPSYCRQRRRRGHSDLAFVEVDGKRLYLGEYGTDESRDAYRRFVAEFAASPAIRTKIRDETPLVAELALEFWGHVQIYYRRRDGTPTSEVANYRRVLRSLREQFGTTDVEEFGPRRLKAMREQWISEGLARETVNSYAKRVRACFRWGVENELVSPSVLEGLKSVRGLSAGRSVARETDPVRPVPDAHIPPVEAFVSKPVWAMVRLQLLTGARPGELVAMRPCDLDRSGAIWESRPLDHKTAYRGRPRSILFGPEAQEVLLPFLSGRSPACPLFSPLEAERDRRRTATARRRTPVQAGNGPGTNRVESPRRRPRDSYSVDSYRRAIVRACIRAKVPAWTPHRLRHNAATKIRKRFGLEAARAILGHSSSVVTEVYAERDREVSIQIASEIG